MDRRLFVSRWEELAEESPPMAQMTAVQIGRAGGSFEVVKREVPVPGPNQVRIKVQA